jgi:hypothetical protein
MNLSNVNEGITDNGLLLNSFVEQSNTLKNSINSTKNNVNSIETQLQKLGPLPDLSNCNLPVCNLINALNEGYECKDEACKNLKSVKETLVTGKLPENCDEDDKFCNFAKNISNFSQQGSCVDNPDNIFCTLISKLQDAITNVVFGLIDEYKMIIFGTAIAIFALFSIMFLILVYLVFLKPYFSAESVLVV